MFNDDESQQTLNGPVSYIHQYVDMTKYVVLVNDSSGSQREVQLCKPAMVGLLLHENFYSY